MDIERTMKFLAENGARRQAQCEETSRTLVELVEVVKALERVVMRERDEVFGGNARSDDADGARARERAQLDLRIASMRTRIEALRKSRNR